MLCVVDVHCPAPSWVAMVATCVGDFVGVSVSWARIFVPSVPGEPNDPSNLAGLGLVAGDPLVGEALRVFSSAS